MFPGANPIHLISFPSEVLRGICTHLTAKELSLLWGCGSSVLNVKLKAPNVVEKFDMDADWHGTRSWPSIISNLRTLRSLRVTAPFPTNFHEIYGLPRTLQSIHFEFWQAEACFALNLDKAALAQSLTTTPLTPNSIHMATMFPNLTYLHLEGSEAVSDFFIGTLPTSLRTLRLFSYRRGELELITEASLDLLPPNLTSLTMIAPFICKPEHVAKIPRGVTYLDLRMCDLYAKALEYLPPSLEELHLPQNKFIQDQDIALLPSTLRVLYLPQADRLTSACFHLLPRNLEMLSAWNRANPLQVQAPGANPPTTFLPLTLKSLHIAGTKNWGEAEIGGLPRGIETLLLHGAKNMGDSFAALLPAGLTSLTAFLNDSLVTGACTATLPRTLTKLDLEVGSSTAGDFKNEFISNLPRNLVSLDLSFASGLTNDCIRFLPQTLTRLFLRHTPHISGTCAHHLPPALVSLSLSSSTDFPGSRFQHLPRTLTYLALPRVTNATGVSFRDLPRGLKYFDITRSTRVEPKHLIALPPGIRHLNLYSLSLCSEYHALRKSISTADTPSAPIAVQPREAQLSADDNLDMIRGLGRGSSSSLGWPFNVVWRWLSPSGA